MYPKGQSYEQKIADKKAVQNYIKSQPHQYCKTAFVFKGIQAFLCFVVLCANVPKYVKLLAQWCKFFPGLPEKSMF